MNLTQPKKYLLLLFLFALLCICLALRSGSSHFSVSDIYYSLFANSHSTAHLIIWQIRFKQAINAFVIGSLLALSGCLLQALLQNPLADPYILGVSGGAACARLSAMALGFSVFGCFTMSFLGAALSMIVLLYLSTHKGVWSAVRMLLNGVMLAMAWSALIAFILSVNTDRYLSGMLFWLMGNVDAVHWPLFPFLVLVGGICFSYTRVKHLNLFMHGEVAARSMGLDTDRFALKIYLMTSLLTATAVANAGCIGFIGLMTPHLVRKVLGSDHRYLIPASVLLGGILLTLADAGARTLFAPIQIPVGVVTAIIGIPISILIIGRQA